MDYRYIGKLDVLSFDDYCGEVDAYDADLKNGAVLARYEENGKKRSAICCYDFIQFSFTPLEEPRMIHIWNEGDIPEELLPEPSPWDGWNHR